MNNLRGISDLMESKRFRPKHIADELTRQKVPGSWATHQNVYNLINGKVMPRDAYVFIVLANLLDVDIKTILYRYSSFGKEVQVSSDDFEW